MSSPTTLLPDNHEELEADISKTQTLDQPRSLRSCITTRMVTSGESKTERVSRRTRVFFSYDGSTSSNIRLPHISHSQVEASSRTHRAASCPEGSNEQKPPEGKDNSRRFLRLHALSVRFDKDALPFLRPEWRASLEFGV